MWHTTKCDVWIIYIASNETYCISLNWLIYAQNWYIKHVTYYYVYILPCYMTKKNDGNGWRTKMENVTAQAVNIILSVILSFRIRWFCYMLVWRQVEKCSYIHTTARCVHFRSTASVSEKTETFFCRLNCERDTWNAVNCYLSLAILAAGLAFFFVLAFCPLQYISSFIARALFRKFLRSFAMRRYFYASSDIDILYRIANLNVSEPRHHNRMKRIIYLIDSKTKFESIPIRRIEIQWNHLHAATQIEMAWFRSDCDCAQTETWF